MSQRTEDDNDQRERKPEEGRSELAKESTLQAKPLILLNVILSYS